MTNFSFDTKGQDCMSLQFLAVLSIETIVGRWKDFGTIFQNENVFQTRNSMAFFGF